ncbi:class I SAM-dependent methyltransferase [Engelhardtia mirabilis]|uniref:dTDP-3-amino-3,4, 6-trideoxy-alpha-D-glucopyranose n=1 Tax=Engelhardtia mirabilis TaxID=2528011 RepID=A0A518BRJ4_9BACT|nr:dTDP-3-amino-3,4,6-trideoxy-alpha-D-glucopyranose [Planctomycetes bacterium Pla133]QDV03925.1 dTDP-3-amino-3,4,6-trideoxy-alpha-D-glucopyranose [Planctomycetes bacterium Pla86]
MPTPRRDDWYRAAFGPLVEVAYGHRGPFEANVQLQSLTRVLGWPPGGGPEQGQSPLALDAGCGAGRHLGALLGAGFRSVGVDLSAARLAQARRRRPTASLVRSDLRRLPLAPGRVDLVLSLFSSFGYHGEDGDLAVLAELARVLRPGGSLVLDLPDPDDTAARLVPRSVRRVGGLTLREGRRLAGGSTVVKRVRIERGRDPVAAWVERLRLYTWDEISRRLAASGFDEARLIETRTLPGFGPGRLLVVARSAGPRQAL